MNLELISFKICPFVQRAVITLLHKKIPYNVTYIDLGSPPDWFKEISPFGKVPVLKVDEDKVIFESAIISEFLNDSYACNLLPEDALQRAMNRSWIEFSTNLTLNFSGMIHAGDKESFEAKRDQTQRELGWLENKLGKGPYFNDDDFSLVDIAYAPLFMRTDMLNLAETLYPKDTFPKVASWADKLLTLPELPGSVVSDFEDLLKGRIRKMAPYAAEQLGLE